jgi:hypothetical protein
VARRKRLRKLGWRWRRNPLRRRTDVVEAWLGVLTTVLLCTAPVLGWWAGTSVDRGLQRVVRAQHAERTLVPVTVLPVGEPAATSAATAATSVRAADPRHGERLRWTGPGHSVHTATVSAYFLVWHADRLLLWTDRAGELAPPPLDTTTATTHAVLAGVATATAAGGLLLLSRQVLTWRLMRRRLDSWEREWARVGQDWGRAGAGG